MNITSYIKEKIRLYGFWGMMQRVFKSIIYAVFKIKWEKCYLMSRTVEKIDYSLSEKGIEVRELKMEDYDNELWITYLTEEKKDTLQKRFKTKNTKGYGVFVNGVLACSAWISFGIIAYNEDTILFKNDKAALLFDAYTHSYFRGNGYHNYMIKWRLNELKHNKIEKAYTSYAKNHKVKHAHALASDSSVTRKLLGKPLYPLFSQIETYYINKGLVGADVIIAQNVFQQQMLSKRYGKESILVNQMTPSVDESCLQKKYNKIKIIWVANFKELKHPELFVQLAKDLKGHSDRIEMYMCGRSTSKYNNLLQDLNHIDYLNYLGSLDQEQVFDLMNEAHILVNTSEYEGFSNTFVQAWMRKVVVVSMNSNPSDILTSQGIGFLTPNMTNLVATIHKLIEHPEIISELGEKSYQYALENHDLNKNMKKIIEVL